MIDIDDYLRTLENLDVDAVANALYNETTQNGEAQFYNVSFYGKDVKDSIVRMALLLRQYFKLKGQDVSSIKDDVENIYNDILDKQYYTIDMTPTVFRDTAILESGGQKWVAPYEGITTKRYAVPSYGFMTLTANRTGIRYGFSNDGDGVSVLADYGETEDFSTDLWPNGYQYLYIMSASGDTDFSVDVKSLQTLKDSFDAAGLDAAEIVRAVNDIDDIKGKFYEESQVSHTVLENTWIYQYSGEWYVGRSQATVGYTTYRFPVQNGKTYRIVGLASGTEFGFASTTGSAEILLYNHGTTENTSEKVTATGKYLYIRAISPTFDRKIQLFYVESLRDKVEDIVGNAWSVGDVGRNIFVAAMNATTEEKTAADYICDGTDDGEEINKALNDLNGSSGSVCLSSGTFYLDTLRTKNGKNYLVSLFNDDATGFKRIIGKGAFWITGGTKLNVTEAVSEALDELESHSECKVFGSTKDASNSCYGCFSNLRVWLPDNKHRYVVVDNSYFNGGYCNDLVLEVKPNGETLGNTVADMPVEGCVGIRGYDGNDNGSINEFNRCFVTGFYEGYQIGGEHLVCKNLGARRNYYSYTFGNYVWTREQASGSYGTQSHPITLINCADESAVCLPKFCRCGLADQFISPESIHLAKQEVNLIDFTIELVSGTFEQETVGLAEEEYPGAFCGKIDFIANGNINTDKTGNRDNTYPDDYESETITVRAAEAYGNHTNIKFWADDNGRNFITRNMTHRLGGTTEERLSYYPNYLQTFYDTTLQQLMIFDGTNWVNTNGTPG